MNIMKYILNILLILSGQLALAQIAIKGETIYTVSSGTITNGVILIKDGKITAIGTADKIKIPADYKIIEGKVVTPGLVDAHSTVGFAGMYNVPADQMQLEKSDPLQPELRAIDAYNPREELVAYLNSFGVTTVHTGHGPGALISGQTLVAKTSGETVETTVIKDAAMLAMTLGSDVSENFKSPGTTAKSIAMLRTALLDAQAYQKKLANEDKTKHPARDLRKEALVRLLTGELKAMITANRSTDIMSAIRLAKEFKLKLVLDGATESYLLIDEIKAAGAEVILHPTMVRGYGDMENYSMETAGILSKAGIKVSLQSGFEGYVPKTRVILYEAAIAVANGLSFEDGLKAITLYPAQVLGMDARVGSLEKGKDADVAIFDGDPFEYTTHVCTVVTGGVVTSDTCR
jgi:imidazolonepropionase-like amidohydrolase